ncbi:MAG: pyroglutamyl-peptidase I [Candidatus Obscuribacterales bacterium]|jgi:pyroglutamyl-peptidase|nr:pyroglutamyl-peptidase I [Candidatus Obscuribacterales bacterium]
MKLIVTGFNAFGEIAENPSEQTIHRLPDFVKVDETDEPIDVAKLTLTTCCSDSWDELKRAIESIKSSMPAEKFGIIMAGVAGNRDKICLERFALNVRQYRIPDNNQHRPDDEHIEPNAPDALRTSLPVKSMVEELNNAGYACDVSNHAGTYVCNETYFRALHEYNSDPNCIGVLFVHVPPFESYKHTDPNHVDEREAKQIFEDAMHKIIQMVAANGLATEV